MPPTVDKTCIFVLKTFCFSFEPHRSGPCIPQHGFRCRVLTRAVRRRCRTGARRGGRWRGRCWRSCCASAQVRADNTHTSRTAWHDDDADDDRGGDGGDDGHSCARELASHNLRHAHVLLHVAAVPVSVSVSVPVPVPLHFACVCGLAGARARTPRHRIDARQLTRGPGAQTTGPPTRCSPSWTTPSSTSSTSTATTAGQGAQPSLLALVHRSLKAVGASLPPSAGPVCSRFCSCSRVHLEGTQRQRQRQRQETETETETETDPHRQRRASSLQCAWLSGQSLCEGL
eukprot:2877503-Rhodomonas_salina.2